MPGFYSSPLLLATSVYAWVQLRRTRQNLGLRLSSLTAARHSGLRLPGSRGTRILVSLTKGSSADDYQRILRATGCANREV